MKYNLIFLITFDEVDYDEYSGCVVIAQNENRAKVLCDITKEKKLYSNKYEDNIKELLIIGKSHLHEQVVLEDYWEG